jgi:MYXO-CTERM domain-containing protein
MPSNDFHVVAHAASTDRGDPADDFSAEPMPNGGRINLGAYGGTAEAELSPDDVPAPIATTGPNESGGCSLAASEYPASPKLGSLALVSLFGLTVLRRRRPR